MAGIYVHIPFCKQACHYCDFHFSTNQSYIDLMIEAICNEIEYQKDYLNQESIGTIYFGGGTPSLIKPIGIAKIIDAIFSHFSIDSELELTLEANPDDLNQAYLKDLVHLGINRLSIGIQSFDPNHLTYLNRAHSALEAERCVKNAQDVGIGNISIDLIYGIPSVDHKIWYKDLECAIHLNVPHISAYCLTIEPNTVFGKWLKTSKIKNVEDEFSGDQFEILLNYLGKYGYEQYEISNFAKDGCYSKHNKNYWNKIKYLGVGPSAHSFNLESRQFNLSNNHLYIDKIAKKNADYFTKEILSEKDHINEHIMLGLRTKEGCNIDFLKNKYNFDLLKNLHLDFYFSEKFMYLTNGNLVLTQKGKFIADKITFDLFLE